MFFVSAAPLIVDLIIKLTTITAAIKIAAILKTLTENSGHLPHLKELVVE